MSHIISIAFEHFVSLFQSGIFVTFCYKFLEPKFSKKLNIIAWAGTIIAMYIAITIQNFISFTFAFSEILLYCAIIIPYCLVCLKGKWYQKIAFPMLFYVLSLSISFIVSFISGAILDVENTDFYGDQYFMLRVFHVTTMLISQLFMLYISLKLYKNKFKLKNGLDIIMFLMLPLLTFSVIFLCFSIASAPSTSDLHVLYLGLIIIAIFFVTVLVLQAMVQLTKNHELKTQNLLMHKEQVMYQNEIDNASKYISEIAKVKHDMKNKIFCIGEMLKSNNINEAVKMCSNISDELRHTSEMFNTKNVYLNSILNVVYNKCRETGIDISVNINCDFRNIEGADLITIIGNLCDNAVEALSKQTQEKILRLNLLKRGNYYILVVKNHIDSSVLSNNPKLNSDKHNLMYHGFGLDSVKRLVKKYNGDIQFTEEGDMFIVRLMLEIPEYDK